MLNVNFKRRNLKNEWRERKYFLQIRLTADFAKVTVDARRNNPQSAINY